MRMSTLLFVPVGNIIFSGLEANITKFRGHENSNPGVIITLMMPDFTVAVLQDIVDDTEKLSAIRIFGVKTVEIENKMYTLTEGKKGIFDIIILLVNNYDI